VTDIRGQLTTYAYKAAARVAQLVPSSVVPPISRVIGRVGGWPQRGNRAMSARHQRRVTGRTDAAVVREVFEWYGRYWIEIFRLPIDVRHGDVVPNFTITGYEYITDALVRGKGAILALPHLGGWEWAAAWMAAQGHHMLAVVEPLHPPELLEWFTRQREAIGLEIVPIGPDVSRIVLKALRDNRIICLLSDRDLTGDGVDVEFFGERTTLPAGPATLALRTGAALLPVAVYFGPKRGHHGVVKAPIPATREGNLREDIARLTQVLANEFEGLIRAEPTQWHLLQPNWPSDRE
jgi:lauroyl/myristoyl acyltransferase